MRAKQNNNTSGTTGVRYNTTYNKWHAQIKGNHLGVFKTEAEAIKARKDAEVEYGFK